MEILIHFCKRTKSIMDQEITLTPLQFEKGTIYAFVISEDSLVYGPVNKKGFLSSKSKQIILGIKKFSKKRLEEIARFISGSKITHSVEEREENFTPPQVESNSELSYCKTEIDALHLELKELHSELEQSENDHLKTKNEYLETKDLLQKEVNKNEILAYKLNDLQSKLNELKPELENKKESINKLTSDLEISRNNFNVQKDLDSCKGDMDKTKSELDVTKGDLNKAKEELNAVKIELDKVKGDLEKTNGELNVTKDNLTKVTDELNITKSQLSDKGMVDISKNKDLELELVKKEQELEFSKKELERINNEIELCNNELLKLDESESQEFKALETRIKESNDELKKCEDKIKELQLELKKKSDELGSQNQLNEELQLAKEELEKTKEELKKTNEELIKAKKELQKTGSCQEELIKAKKEASQLKEELQLNLEESGSYQQESMELDKIKEELRRANEELNQLRTKSKIDESYKTGKEESKNGDLERELFILNEEFEKVKDELAQAKRDLNRFQQTESGTQLANELQKIKEELVICKQQKKASIDSSNKIKTELDQTKTQLNELEVIRKTLEGELDSLSEQLKTKQESEKDLEKQLSKIEMETELDKKQVDTQVQIALKDTDKQLRQLTEEINKKDTQLRDIQNQIVQKDLRLGELTADLEREEQEIVQKDKLIQKNNKELQDLNLKVATLEKELYAAKEIGVELEKETGQIVNLQNELTKCNNQLSDLAQDQILLEQAQLNCEKLSKDTLNTNQKLKNQVSTLTQQMDQLLNELQKYKLREQDLQSEIQTLDIQLENARMDKKGKTEETILTIDNLKIERQKVQKELELCRSDQLSCQKDSQTLKSTIDALNKDISDIQVSLGSCERDSLELEKANKILENKINELQAKLKDQQKAVSLQEIDISKSKELESDLLVARNEIDKLEKELLESKAALDEVKKREEQENIQEEMTINSLQKDLAEKTKEYNDILLKFNDLQGEMERYKKESETKLKDCESISSTINRCEKELYAISEERDRIMVNLTELQKKSSEDIYLSKGDLQKLQADKEGLELKLSEANEKLEAETKKYIKLASDQRDELNALAEKEELLTNIKSEYSRLEDALSNSKIELDKKRQVIDNINIEKENLSSKLDIIAKEKQETLIKLEKCETGSNQALLTLNSELASTKDKLDFTEKKLALIEKDAASVSELKEQLSQLQTQIEISKEQKETCEKKSTEKDIEINNLVEEVTVLKNKSKELVQQIQTQQNDLIILANEKDSLTKTLNSQAEKYSQITHKLERSQQECERQTFQIKETAKNLDVLLAQTKEELKGCDAKNKEKIEQINKERESITSQLNTCREKELSNNEKLLKIEEAKSILEEKWGSKNKELEAQLVELDSILKQTEEKLNKKVSENQIIEDQFKKLSNELASQKSSSEDLLVIKTESEKKIAALESKVNELKGELTQLYDEKKSVDFDITTVKNDLTTKQNTINQLTDQRDSLQANVVQLTKQIEETSNSKESEEMKLRANLESLEEKEKEILGLKQNLELCQTDSKKLSEQLEKMKSDINDSTSDSKKIISELQLQIEDLKRDLQTRDLQISTLTNEVEELKNKLSVNDQELKVAKEKLEQNISQKEQELSSVQREAKLLSESGETLQTKIKGLEEALAKSEGQLTETTRFEEQLSICNKELETIKTSIDTKSVVEETIRNELAESIKKRDQLEQELNACKETSSSGSMQLSKKLEDLEKELGELKGTLNEKQSQIDLLEAKNSELNLQLKDLTDTQITKSKDELNLLVEEMNSVKFELSKVTEERDSLQNVINIKSSQVNELESKLNSVKEICDAESDKLRKEIERISIALDETKQSKLVPQTDFTECNKDLENYKIIRESLKSKREILTQIDSIINSSIYLTSLDSSMRSKIKESYKQIKTFMLEKIDSFKFDKLDLQIEEEKKTSGVIVKLSDEICSNLSILFKSWNESVDDFNKFNEQLVNLFEDLLGAVRVYVRIKTPGNVVKSSGNNKYVDVIGCGPEAKFGPFFGVFEKDNSNVFNNDQFGLKSSFDQLMSGYSIVLFGYGASGSGKCLGRGTEVLMYNGSIKKVEDILVDDLVMGDDSTPRRVLSLARGRDLMYEIKDSKGRDTYTVNSEHILTLMGPDGNVIDISLKDYLSLSEDKRHLLKGFKVPIAFDAKELDVDPYTLGLAGNLKEIPFDFKCNSHENRLRLLAGLIDSQFKVGDKQSNGISFTSIHSKLLKDVIFLARSLGLVCYKTGHETIMITGKALNKIPSIRIIGKTFMVTESLEDHIQITPVGEDEYFGFTLDNNSRFVLGNFTVTHNSYTLLGSGKDTPGILQLSLEYLMPHAKQINLKYAFEHYLGVATTTSITGEIIDLIDNKLPEFSAYKAFYKDNEVSTVMNKLSNAGVSLTDLKLDSINPLIKVIDTHRIDTKRIKSTPNNPQSSRSHLFLVFEILLKNGKKSFLTIIDSAGRESPDDIRETFTTGITLQTAIGLPDIPSDKLKQANQYNGKYVIKLLKEGIFINETINHLTWFFNKKTGKSRRDPPKQSSSKYSNEAVYITPKSEYFDETSTEFISQIEKGKNPFVFKQAAPNQVILTIPILQFLDNLKERTNEADPIKPTKFIMICNVRQEPKYCNQTLATIKFANDIKST